MFIVKFQFQHIPNNLKVTSRPHVGTMHKKGRTIPDPAFDDSLSWHLTPAVRLQLRKRSTVELVSCNETQTSETKCIT